MSGVTLKILHGADRGKIYEDHSPSDGGREEGMKSTQRRAGEPLSLQVQRDVSASF